MKPHASGEEDGLSFRDEEFVPEGAVQDLRSDHVEMIFNAGTEA